jgi:DNA-binding response OmpR family regulator
MADNRPYKILAIDDDPLILDLVELFLAEFNVTIARGGVRGRMLLQTHRPNLVILDVAMPDLDGLSALRWIRAQRKLDQTTVMMLTSKADRATIAEAMAAGADGYMIKPFTGENLMRRTRQMLKQVRIAA